jgi:hypothetical protein
MCELLKVKPPSGRNPVIVVKLCGRELSWCTKLRDAVTAIEILPTVSLCSSSSDRLMFTAASGITHKSKLLRCLRNLLQSWETSTYYLPQQTLSSFRQGNALYCFTSLTALIFIHNSKHVTIHKTGVKQSFLIHCYITSYVAECTHYLEF